MATVYKRGNTYWVRFQWRGQEIRKSARTTVKSEAREYLAEIQAEYRRLDLGGKPRVQFSTAAVAYIEEHLPTRKASTVRSYQQYIKVLAGEFGEMYLDEITRSKIAAFEAKQMRRVAPSKVKQYRVALSGIFRIARRHQWVEVNPCRDLDPIEIRNARYRFLSQEEWQALSAELADPILGIAETSVLRGMRLGEIVNLRWRDLDFGADTITMPDTKSNRPRVLPMEVAAPVFDRQDRYGPFVFPTIRGQAHRVDGASRKINEAGRRAGLDDFTAHDLRHTFASWYIQRHGDIFRLKEILGHTTIATTQRYTHLLTDHLRTTAQKPAQWTG